MMIYRIFVLMFSIIVSMPTLAQAKKILDIQQWQTKNGAKVLFVQAKELPMVDVLVAFAGGSARDDDKPGIASLTNYLVDQGTQKFNANQIAEKFDEVGAQFESDAHRDTTIFSLRSLTQARLFTPALETFRDVLAHADFPLDAVNRAKKMQLASIKQQQQSPSSIATMAFYKALYANYPYGHPVVGNAESVQAITRNDIRRFYQTYFVAKNATIAIVGAVSRNQAESIANYLTHDLPSGQAAPALPKPSFIKGGGMEAIKFPATQTSIRIGQIGIEKGNKDYFPLLVGNYVLGGGALVSRLNDEVREKRGLSYSVYSMFLPMAAPGPFVISLGTRNDQARLALDVTRKTLQQFLSKGPSEKELRAAKQHITGSFPMKLDSNKKIATAILALGFYNMPLNYFDLYAARINAVSKAQVVSAFKKYLQPNKMVTIQVGRQNNAKKNS